MNAQQLLPASPDQAVVIATQDSQEEDAHISLEETGAIFGANVIKNTKTTRLLQYLLFRLFLVFWLI